MDIKRFYDNILDPIFLVEYGYYDLSKKNLERKIDYLQTYGRSDSFYPNIFNMNNFAKYLRDIKGIDILKQELGITNSRAKKNHRYYVDTEPIYFSIPKGEYERRQYKMPNLYSYMRLAFLVYDNKQVFIDKFTDNKYSTSKYFGYGTFNYRITHEIKEKLLYGGIKILNVDLANFYHTLYTHSIQWMLLGKKEAKKKQSGTFEANLDWAIRNCQYGETHGIPTGNLISRIIAELYMCFFDEKMENENISYARYVDDFTFAFTFDKERVEFLKLFSLICRENNLLLREEKTYVENFPIEDKQDKTKMFDFFEGMNSNASINKWINKISNFITFCISQESIGNKSSLKVMFTVLENMLKRKKQYQLSQKMIQTIFCRNNEITGYNIFERILDISLKDSRLTNRFLKLTETIVKKSKEENNIRAIVKQYFKREMYKIVEKIEFYIHNNYDQELYQLLLYMVIFNVENILTKEKLLKLFENELDDFSLILLTILYLKNSRIDEQKKLLEKIDDLMKRCHENYPNLKSRMQEKLWLFRYFFYYIKSKAIISDKEYKLYCQDKEYSAGKRGYETDLNWKYVKGNTVVDNFFDNMLSNGVWLVHCGKNNDFNYSFL